MALHPGSSAFPSRFAPAGAQTDPAPAGAESGGQPVPGGRPKRFPPVTLAGYSFRAQAAGFPYPGAYALTPNLHYRRDLGDEYSIFAFGYAEYWG